MKTDNLDPEDSLARLGQEATNQSTPDKSLSDAKARRVPKLKVPRRPKAPKAD